MHIWKLSIHKGAKAQNREEKRVALSIKGIVKPDIHKQMTKTESFSYTVE